MQHSSGSGQSAAAGSILPTQQQLHEIYEENLRLREEVVKSGPASAEAAAARNQVCHWFFLIFVTFSKLNFKILTLKNVLTAKVP